MFLGQSPGDASCQACPSSRQAHREVRSGPWLEVGFPNEFTNQSESEGFLESMEILPESMLKEVTRYCWLPADDNS